MLRRHDRLMRVYGDDGGRLRLVDRLAADRTVATDPFPVVFRIEDLLLP